MTADVAAVRDWVAARRAEMVADLVALVSLETPSDDTGLLDAALRSIESWVVERLGAPEGRTLHPAEDHGDVLVLDFAGDGEQQVVALCHYDTVFDAGTLAGWPVRVDGDRLSGPGAFDMKAGLVQCVWALRALDALGVPRPPVRLVLSGDEEIGSPFSRPLLEKAAQDAAAVLVFEASVDGAVKTARKGVGLFELVAEGIEAHAGLDPLAGASAVHALADVVVQLCAAADLAAGTSINVGTFRGGTRANVTAGAASAQVDVRVVTAEEQRRVDDVLRGLTVPDERVRLEVRGGWNRPVMERGPQIAAMYEVARAAAAAIGVDLQEASAGGASDGNFVAALGIPVLDGLGAVGNGAHARSEHVSIDGMVERAAVAAGVFAHFAA
ncbi:M20 family metallopeptidase [Puerhibacterium puerhi]|uniref:M20 family metallopeptidase n=1 Tax=Puerhibacterium puerhi TaxID=2692623 RepID=UPI001915EAD1|nr:M20 family metallopeptidase [Puerhibacterium puerhi]